LYPKFKTGCVVAFILVSDGSSNPIWEWILSLDPFSLAILFIILSTLVGTLMQGRSRDRCYKRLSGFNVFLVLDDGKVEGVLCVGNAGIEIKPEDPPEGPFGPRTGFVLPKAEYGRISTIYTIPDQMNDVSAGRRKNIVNRVLHPGVFTRAGRWFSNLAGSFKDAFTQLFNLVAGKMNASLGGIKSQQSHISKIQQEMASAIPNASYDVILEKLRGNNVEIDLNIPGMPNNISAVLGDYTSTNIFVLDVTIPADSASSPEDTKLLFTEKVDAVFPRTVAQVKYRLGKTGATE